jgi:arylsulfatase A-like enzyme
VPPPPGKSLTPVFARDGTVTHDELWWQHEGNRAIRAGDWKLVAAGKDAAWELYNLSADRAESRNLAAMMPEKVSELRQRWEQRFTEFGDLARKDAPKK